ncbi:dTDP-4-dehydrorhamnose reductase [Terribacillus saccharophilus]|uniref:dTDP-4-dehydrorhamnose reductase n=1 Tax=Terribacillus saccharophilus TaxID=361277 RepID=UPI002989CF21|nr:dTDP-4-dehydrorhamnose reductase [Terribacillus saccharophilus]MCM3225240.1 dTDP-4-dehydrorhamnose reductase [Terribacillus saccharophilus]
MKILVTGSSGQVGSDVVIEAKRRGHEVIGINSTILDITFKQEVIDFIENLKPDVVIHCAAYTQVDKAETFKNECYNVNVEGTKNIAIASKLVDAKLIYISTDYVFDGFTPNKYYENSQCSPVNYYGKTKFLGEEVVREICTAYFIVRISWVFGKNGNNFVKTMLRLSETNKVINVVNDQVGSPTFTEDLSKLLIDFTTTERYGTYHATNQGTCSWAEFASKIFEVSGKDSMVKKITTSEYKTPAKRPSNSVLGNTELEKNGFSKLPHWEDALNRFLKEES